MNLKQHAKQREARLLRILDFLDTNPGATSTEIQDKLFPASDLPHIRLLLRLGRARGYILTEGQTRAAKYHLAKELTS